MKTATNSQDYERHTVSTRLTLHYDGHAVVVSHYACRAQTSQVCRGKVPGLCPQPQVFEKEDEPNRNRTWIRLLRHETGRPVHVQVKRSGLHRRRRSRILSAVRNSCWLFTLAHACLPIAVSGRAEKVTFTVAKSASLQ